jgi:outer membrane protein assembly factor BamB
MPAMSKRVGRVVVGLLSLGLAATAEPSVAAGEQRYVWQKQNVAQLPLDADGDTVFFTRTRMCAQSYRRLRLVCWDTKTGAEALRYERDLPAGSKPTSLLYQRQGAWVTLAYQAGNKVFVRRVELDKGAEQRAFDFTLSDSPNPVARTFGISGSSLVVVYRIPDPKDAKLPKNGKQRPKWLGRARVVSTETGANIRDFALDLDPSKWELAGDTVYVERSSMEGDAVSGFDISTGKKRFSHPFGKSAFIHGIGAGPNGVYVQLDDKVVKLDEKTGQIKGTGAIGKEGNPGPVVNGDRVYVCERGVHVFDSNLKRIARVEAPDWVIDCNVSDGYVSIESHHNGYLVDLTTNELLASAEVRAEKFLQATGIFDGTGLPLIETEGGQKTRGLTLLARVPAEELQVAGLPAGASVVEDGAPVGSLLARGEHQLDLFRPGFRPVRQKLKVGSATARLDVGAVAWQAAPTQPAKRFDQAPAGTELTQIAAARGRGEQTFNYGSFGNFTDAGRRVGLEGRLGLFARSLRTGRDQWTVPFAEIDALTGPSNGSSSAPDFFAVLEQSRLALIGSKARSPGVILAYDLDTGKLRWQSSYSLHRPPSAGEYYYPRAVEYSGAFWFVSSEALYGYDVNDGHLVYFHDFGLREGSWGVPVFHGGTAYINHRDLIVGLDLTTRQIVMRARVPGRGLLTLGPDDASLLFVDDKSARLISFEGKSLAQSPQLAGGLDDNPVVIEPDAIFLCGQYKLQTHALDRKTLKPRWTFTNKNGLGGGQSLCPSLFSANQVATLDAKRTVILDRKNGKVLFDQLGALPNSRYMTADANGFCFHIRKGSACLDR